MADDVKQSGGDQQYAAGIDRIAAAVDRIAERIPAARERSATDVEAERRRDLAVFIYRATGTVMGRQNSSGASEDFSVRVVQASRTKSTVALKHLPEAAAWVELRNGRIAERLQIERGIVTPKQIDAREAIGAIIVLDDDNGKPGQPIAFGPRLAPYAR